MKKRKKLKRIILKSKQRGWSDCADVMKEELKNQINRQKYLFSVEIEALENEIKRISTENKKLKQEYLNFIDLKNNLLYQSRKMRDGTLNLNKDLMSIVQRFLKIADSSERIDNKYNKIEEKIKRMVR